MKNSASFQFMFVTKARYLLLLAFGGLAIHVEAKILIQAKDLDTITALRPTSGLKEAGIEISHCKTEYFDQEIFKCGDEKSAPPIIYQKQEFVDHMMALLSTRISLVGKSEQPEQSLISGFIQDKVYKNKLEIEKKVKDLGKRAANFERLKEDRQRIGKSLSENDERRYKVILDELRSLEDTANEFKSSLNLVSHFIEQTYDKGIDSDLHDYVEVDLSKLETAQDIVHSLLVKARYFHFQGEKVNIGPFENGLALVSTGSSNFFIDRLGPKDWQINIEKSRGFSAGYAVIEASKKFSVIDSEGRTVIPESTDYDYIGQFYAPPKTLEKDSQLAESHLDQFETPRAIAQHSSGWGLLFPDGEFIPFVKNEWDQDSKRYYDKREVSSNLVRAGDLTEFGAIFYYGERGYLNANIIFDHSAKRSYFAYTPGLKPELLSYFSWYKDDEPDGSLVFIIQNFRGKRFGKFNDLKNVSDFSADNIARIEKEDGSLIYVKSDGKFILPKVDSVVETKDFHQGYAAVRHHGGWVFIDKEGNPVFSPIGDYDEALPYSDGVFGLRSGSILYFFDEHGEIFLVIQTDQMPKN